MEIQRLPQEMEKMIYNYAFGIDEQFIVKECLSDKNYLESFVQNHSYFLIRKIDWYNFFVSMLQEYGDITENKSLTRPQIAQVKEAIENNLINFMMLIKYKKLGINKEVLKSFHKSTRMYGGDAYYEYIFDDLSLVENLLERL